MRGVWGAPLVSGLFDATRTLVAFGYAWVWRRGAYSAADPLALRAEPRCVSALRASVPDV